MRVTLVCGAVVLLLGAITATAGPITETGEHIDGKNTTIALAIIHQLIGLIPNETVKALLFTIIDALTKKDFDYWGEVKDDVAALVGQYINAHNMHQVEVYQTDLVSLMERYNNAPVESDIYPDKNHQAAALSTSIITHRYLIEAAELPQSMILHFEDISSIHVVVLKDAAVTYSFEGHEPSRWWVDLDEELDHYITYGKKLEGNLHEWRQAMISCHETYNDNSRPWLGAKYDTFIVTDLVTGEVSTCKQLEGTHDCENHCDLYRQHKENEVGMFTAAKVNSVLDTWVELKNVSSHYAGQASRFYNPLKGY
ncbi:uncharacterized protein LOC121862700 [Homarus americanus]|nr:uncharacterized protein LOC121862700 [Homarus americanus]